MIIDSFYIACKYINKCLVFGTLGKLIEIGSQFIEISFGFSIVMKTFHQIIGFLAENEQSNVMVGRNIVDFVDIGNDKLEDEHYFVSLVQVFPLILLNRC